MSSGHNSLLSSQSIILNMRCISRIIVTQVILGQFRSPT
jgi:hypothetical protein